MRDVPAALDREAEVAGHAGGPVLVGGRALQRVERAVDLDRVEVARHVLELAPLRQSWRVEPAPPVAVPPPGQAHPDLAHGVTLEPRSAGGSSTRNATTRRR